MSWLIALLLNGLLLLAAVAWLRREARVSPPALRRWLGPALAARLLLTALSAARPSPDALMMTRFAAALTADLRARPTEALGPLLSHAVRDGDDVMRLYPLSNSVFFIKLLGLLNFASLGNYYLTALYLSLFCFAGCWSLTRVWGRTFPATPLLAPLLAFLLWPSVLWWTAGIIKETVLLGAEAALVALGLPLLFGGRATAEATVASGANAAAPDSQNPVQATPAGITSTQMAPASAASLPAAPPQERLLEWLPGWLPGWLLGRLLGIVLLSGLAVRMRYFFALPLLGALLIVGGAGWLTRRGWISAGRRAQLALTLGLLLGGGALGWWGLNTLLPPDFLPQQLYRQYEHGLATSQGRPHLTLPGLVPTAGSMLAHAPSAIGQVLTRPWPGESSQLSYVAAAFENLLLLSLLGVAAYALARGRPGRLPLSLVLALLAYCLLLAAFIGLSTPNLGTMHRYRAMLLPWLLVLLLQKVRR